MKNYLKNSRIKRILYYLVGFFIFVLIMNYIVMPWYVDEPEKPVPKVIGLNTDDAISILRNADLVPVIGDTTYDEKYPKGSIIYQRPNAGEIVKINRRIYLFISGGEPIVAVPVLIGKSIRDAKFSLERVGLNLGKIDSVASTNPSNMIFDQQFAAGTSLKKGDYVGVSLSIGNNANGIIVPNLIGKSLTEAEKILVDSTLKVGKINYQPSVSLLPNTVLDQYPSNGIRVTSGSSIDLFLTKPTNTDNRQ